MFITLFQQVFSSSSFFFLCYLVPISLVISCTFQPHFFKIVFFKINSTCSIFTIPFQSCDSQHNSSKDFVSRVVNIILHLSGTFQSLSRKNWGGGTNNNQGKSKVQLYFHRRKLGTFFQGGRNMK